MFQYSYLHLLYEELLFKSILLLVFILIFILSLLPENNKIFDLNLDFWLAFFPDVIFPNKLVGGVTGWRLARGRRGREYNLADTQISRHNRAITDCETKKIFITRWYWDGMMFWLWSWPRDTVSPRLTWPVTAPRPR